MPDTDNQDDPGRLRKDNDSLRKTNRELAQRLALMESGYTHLTPKQQKAVIRDLEDDKLEVTGENVKAAAEALGYQPPDTKTDTTTTTDTGANGNGDGQQQTQPDPLTAAQLAAMQTMVNANNVMGTGTPSASGQMTAEEFWRKMTELREIDDEDGNLSMQLIREHGAVVGLGDGSLAD